MRATDFIYEAKMDPGIKEVLTKKGYKFVGKGQDQDVYLAPDGTIMKIFGYEKDSRNFSRGQQSFIDFATFCQKNPNNKFLPQFGGWETFDFNGQRYLQIKSERLFEVEKSMSKQVAWILEDLTSFVRLHGAAKGAEKFFNIMLDPIDPKRTAARDAAAQVVMLLGGKEDLKLFARTVEQLGKIAHRKGYGFDLHGGNFMLGSDGEIVINDPFFTGTWRK